VTDHAEQGHTGCMADRPRVNNLKRFTVCLAGHKWAKIAYPSTADGEPTGTFLRCLRCAKENHNAGSVPRGAGGVF
jgi:hypothetical protein